MYLVVGVIGGNLLHNLLGGVVEDDNVVGVPADGAGDVELDFIAEGQVAGEFGTDGLGGMEVARVHADDALAGVGGVLGVELVGAGDIGFAAQTEDLGLAGVDVVLQRLCENLVQGVLQNHAGAELVHADVLAAVADPVVGDALLAQLAAKVVANLPAGDAVLNPEPAHALVGAGEGGAGVELRVRKVGGVEIQTDAPLLGVVHPLGKFGGGNLVAADVLAVLVHIDGVEGQLGVAGNQV